jgi:hypothetical protein
MTTLSAVETLALELPEQQRATLAVHLLESLPRLFSEDDGGAAEALRRDSELDSDASIGLSLTDFDQKLADRRAE